MIDSDMNLTLSCHTIEMWKNELVSIGNWSTNGRFSWQHLQEGNHLNKTILDPRFHDVRYISRVKKSTETPKSQRMLFWPTVMLHLLWIYIYIYMYIYICLIYILFVLQILYIYIYSVYIYIYKCIYIYIYAYIYIYIHICVYTYFFYVR